MNQVISKVVLAQCARTAGLHCEHILHAGWYQVSGGFSRLVRTIFEVIGSRMPLKASSVSIESIILAKTIGATRNNWKVPVH